MEHSQGSKGAEILYVRMGTSVLWKNPSWDSKGGDSKSTR